MHHRGHVYSNGHTAKSTQERGSNPAARRRNWPRRQHPLGQGDESNSHAHRDDHAQSWSALQTLADVAVRMVSVIFLTVCWELCRSLKHDLSGSEYTFDGADLIPIRHPVWTAVAVLVFDWLSAAAAAGAAGFRRTNASRSSSLYRRYCILTVVDLGSQCNLIVSFLFAKLQSANSHLKRMVDTSVGTMSSVAKLLERILGIVRFMIHLLHQFLKVVGYILLPIWYPVYWFVTRGRRREQPVRVDLSANRPRQTSDPRPAIQGQAAFAGDDSGQKATIQYNIYLVANGDNAQAQLVDQVRQTFSNREMLMLQPGQRGFQNFPGQLQIENA